MVSATPGDLLEILVAQGLHEAHTAATALRRYQARAISRSPARARIGIIDPVIETAALQRVVDFTGAVEVMMRSAAAAP